MDIKDALRQASKQLQIAKIKSTRDESRLLLCFVLKKSPEFILANPEQKITSSQFNKFTKLIRKRATDFPVAYLTNEKYFYNKLFFVNESVLIPRPETELLVDEALKIIGHKIVSICELGTGSGCISITLAGLAPQANYLATDISPAALKIARKNNHTHQTKVHLKQSDLLSSCGNEPIDLLIANLPYVPDNLTKLTKSNYSKSLKYEPTLALIAGKDGLAVYRKLFSQLAEIKNKPKYILIEIGENQTNKIKKIIKTSLMNPKIEFIKDLRGLNRVVKITL